MRAVNLGAVDAVLCNLDGVLTCAAHEREFDGMRIFVGVGRTNEHIR